MAIGAHEEYRNRIAIVKQLIPLEERLKKCPVFRDKREDFSENPTACAGSDIGILSSR